MCVPSSAGDESDAGLEQDWWCLYDRVARVVVRDLGCGTYEAILGRARQARRELSVARGGARRQRRHARRGGSGRAAAAGVRS